MSDSWYTLRARGDDFIHNKYHIPEIHNIAIEEAEKREEQLLTKFETIIDNVAESVIGAFKSDVNTVVKIGFSNGKEIFEDKRTQEIVSTAICNAFKDELHKQLRNIKIK